jgi:hypothetical protein
MMRFPRVLRIAFPLFGLGISIPYALAWDDAGHLPTVQIAYDRLSAASQQSLQAQLSGLAIAVATGGDKAWIPDVAQ